MVDGFGIARERGCALVRANAGSVRSGRSIVSIFLAALLASLDSFSLVAQERANELMDEYRVKAQYLYSLSKFIVWPGEHAWRSSSPLDVCVYGSNPFSTHLEELRPQAARSHPIVVRVVGPQRSALGCRILFVGADNDMPPQLASGELAAAGVLTVGESEEFLRRGGLVSLVTEDNAVRIGLNYTRAKEAGFVIDGGLLDVAKKLE